MRLEELHGVILLPPFRISFPATPILHVKTGSGNE